jgi:hypothetical protein
VGGHSNEREKNEILKLSVSIAHVLLVLQGAIDFKLQQGCSFYRAARGAIK